MKDNMLSLNQYRKIPPMFSLQYFHYCYVDNRQKKLGNGQLELDFQF